MTTFAGTERVHAFYTMRKDVGVALVVLVALTLGLLLRGQVEGRTKLFRDPGTKFGIAYPATWGSADSLQDVLLKVEDPRANSAFKTTMTVEARGIDPASPPTLQQLVDRRVLQHGALTGYHFLSSDSITAGGAKAMRSEYAYVVQPIDEPRRASLPVVVHAIEYVLVAQEDVFYITLAAPETEFASANAQLSKIMESVQLQ